MVNTLGLHVHPYLYCCWYITSIRMYEINVFGLLLTNHVKIDPIGICKYCSDIMRCCGFYSYVCTILWLYLLVSFCAILSIPRCQLIRNTELVFNTQVYFNNWHDIIVEINSLLIRQGSVLRCCSKMNILYITIYLA